MFIPFLQVPGEAQNADRAQFGALTVFFYSLFFKLIFYCFFKLIFYRLFFSPGQFTFPLY